jgi:serine/threonine-protein kinase
MEGYMRKSEPDQREGQHIGSYRLIRPLGGHGLTEVYLAEHTQLHTTVAIKLMHGRRERHEVTKFLIQAQTLTELRHPHIVPVLDFGIKDDFSFLVMDYAPHGSLRQRHVRGTRLPLNIILLYVQQVSCALHYVHQHNLVHRDVKPHNMLLGVNDEVMLSDFGIAVISHSLASIHPELDDFEGTILYAAPEQLQGKPRRRSDQYALGVVVYEWLSGDWPFSGSFDEITHHHLFTPPPSLQEKGITLPSTVEQVVIRALEKDPAARFPSVEDFAQALADAIAPHEEPPLTIQPEEFSHEEPALIEQPSPRRQFKSPLPFSR